MKYILASILMFVVGSISIYTARRTSKHKDISGVKFSSYLCAFISFGLSVLLLIEYLMFLGC